MFRVFLASLLAMVFSLPAPAGIQSFPSDFKTKDIQTDGATIHVRMGRQGHGAMMLHGFADTGDMWAPLAAELARDHTVIVPDLRGMDRRPILKPATTRKRKGAISPACWTT